MKIINFILPLIIGLLGCGVCEQEYHRWLVVPANVSPHKDTIQVGDTLTVSAKFSKFLLNGDDLYEGEDPFKGSLVDVSGLSLPSIFAVTEVLYPDSSIRYQPHAYDKFEAFATVGILEESDDYCTNYCANFQPLFEQDSFEYELNFIPKEAGLFHFNFAIDITRLGDRLKTPVIYEDNKKRISGTFIYQFGDAPQNDYNNFYLVKENSSLEELYETTSAYVNDEASAKLYMKATYTFVVRE